MQVISERSDTAISVREKWLLRGYALLPSYLIPQHGESPVNKMVVAKVKVPTANVPEKVVLIDTLADRLEGNSNFPTPKPTVSALRAAGNALRAANENALFKGTDRTQAVRTAEKEVDKLLRQTVLYVSLEAEGDADKIYSAGLLPVIRKSTRGKREQQAIPGPLPGTLTLIAASMPNSYKNWEECTDVVLTETSTWKVIAQTMSGKVVVNSHQSGQHLWVRLFTVSKAGVSAYSDPMSVIVR